MGTQHHVGDLLVWCVREASSGEPSSSLLSALARTDPAALAAAAEYHGVAPAIYGLVGSSSELPEGILAGLERAYRLQWQVQLRSLADLAEVVPVLGGLGVPWAVVKGPVLAEVVYDRSITRSYIDLDVLVHRSTLPDVLDALEASGAWVRDRNWTLVRSGMRGELTMGLRYGSALDLHWHLFNEPRVRRAFSVSIEELLARTRDVWVNGTRTPTLDPSDTLVHIAAHASLAGGNRLVWFKDLQQLIEHDAPDWDAVIRRSRASGLALLVATMLERSRRIFYADVPSNVLQALAPRFGWRAVVGLAGRLSPAERSFDRLLSTRTVVAATRRSTPASAAELARAVAVEVVKPLFTEPGHPWRRWALRRPPLTDVFTDNPLAHPSGEVEDRAAFLDHISRAPVEP